MHKHRYMIANWKMHGGLESTRAFVATLDSACWNVPSHVLPIFAPPALFLPIAARARSYGSRVQLAAQDVSAEPNGAHTGDISATMLYECGVRYTIIGHSERRQHHGEDDALVKQKAMRAQEAGLIPIICIGETAEEALAGQTAEVLKRQLSACEGLDMQSIILAYEPVWAIGTGKTPTPEDIATNHAMIIQMAKEAGDSAPPVVYGGSVKPENTHAIMDAKGVSGALIGSASLAPDAMAAMLTTAGAVQKEE